MPDLRIDIDVSGYAEEIADAQARQIPFATALALTRTAQDGQIEVRREAAQKFKLRNAFTLAGVKITAAQKSAFPIQAEVYTDTGNDKSGAPDYLIPQEEGAEKVPHAGGNHIAIPTRYLRAHAPGIIPDALRPRNLLPVDAQLDQSYRGRLDGPVVGPRSRQLSSRRIKAIGSAEFVAFLKYDHAGTLCIFVRIKGARDVEPWYVLVTEARIRAVLEMVPTLERVVNERFEQHWDDAWDEINAQG